MRLVFVLTAVCGLLATAAGQPAFDGEFLMDTSVVPVPASEYQEYPDVAFDGTNFLVVWFDQDNYGYDILGARVAPDGTILDPVGIAMAASADYQLFPAAASNGSGYLVVWEGSREGSTSNIYGTRVAPSGVVLDPGGIAVSTTVDVQGYPAVASDGTNHLVVWQDSRRDSGAIFGCRVTQAGALLDPDGIAISADAHSPRFPAVAFDGANFLVVWEDGPNRDADIHGIRVSPAGVVLDSQDITISAAAGDQSGPALAFDGTNFVVAWQDNRSGGYDVFGCRVTPAGAVLDPGGIAISTAENTQFFVTVASVGTNSLVSWTDERPGADNHIYCCRITPQGTVLDSEGIAIRSQDDDLRNTASTADGTNFFVVWQDGRNGYDGVFGSRVTPQGSVLDSSGTLMSTAAQLQQRPASAYDGENFLVAWGDNRTDSRGDIYGVRVSPAGQVLEPSSIAISTAWWTQSWPDLTFDGTSFLAVWHDRRDTTYHVYGARVAPEGVLLDTQGIIISDTLSAQGSPAVASGHGLSLVVWTDDRNEWYGDIYGARVTPARVVLDPQGVAISTAPLSQASPAVAFGDTEFLVVWVDDSGDGSDVYGARVTPAGVVLDSQGIAITNTPDDKMSPAIAFDGTNFLVVWRSQTAGRNSDIYGCRVTPEGVVLDPDAIAISTSPAPRYEPAIAWDGRSYLVVWAGIGASDTLDIFGCRVSPRGLVLDSGPVVVQDGVQRYPSLARNSGGRVLLAYQGWADTVGGTAYRTDRIWGKMNPMSGIEEGLKPQASSPKPDATVVRGCLFLPSALPTAHYSLLSADGRKVMELRSGPNDVHLLPAGVYFVVTPSPVSSPPEGERVGVRGREASGVKRDVSSVERVSKVIVTR